MTTVKDIRKSGLFTDFSKAVGAGLEAGAGYGFGLGGGTKPSNRHGDLMQGGGKGGGESELMVIRSNRRVTIALGRGKAGEE